MKVRHPALTILGVIAIAFLALPLVALMLRVPWSGLPSILTSRTTLDALRLSLVTSLLSVSLCILLGVPLALLLARASFRGKSLVRALTTLPLVLPPVVGGVALLMAYGRRGVVGRTLYSLFDLTLFGSPLAVVLAATFVALPFLVLTVEAAFRSLDRRYEDVAQTLGASRTYTLRRVVFPLIGPSLSAGAVLAWARALGEFGATITFAGNAPSRTQTLPLAVYVELQAGLEGAVALSVVLMAVSLVVLIAMRNHILRAL